MSEDNRNNKRGFFSFIGGAIGEILGEIVEEIIEVVLEAFFDD